MGKKPSAILKSACLGVVCTLVTLAAAGAFLGYQDGVGARPNVPPGIRGAVAGALAFLSFLWPVAAVVGFLGGCLWGLAIKGIKGAVSRRRQCGNQQMMSWVDPKFLSSQRWDSCGSGPCQIGIPITKELISWVPRWLWADASTQR
jgi:hypothetical protein